MQPTWSEITGDGRYAYGPTHEWVCPVCWNRHTESTAGGWELGDITHCFHCTTDFPEGTTSWNVSRDGGLGYSDEWEPSNSWTATKRISTARKVFSDLGGYGFGYGPPRGDNVDLVVRIHGRWRSGRSCRPIGMGASLKFGHDYQEIVPIPTSPRTGRPRRIRSIAEALRIADALDLSEPLAKLLKRYYSPENSVCTWRWDRDARQWVPWMTELSRWDAMHWRRLDHGTDHYLRASSWYAWKEKKRMASFSHYRMGGGGYSAGSIEKEFLPAPEPWLDFEKEF